MSTSIAASTVAADELVVTAKPCNVLDVQVISNDDTNELYLMLFDSATVPANGAYPRWRAVVPTQQQVSVSFLGDDPHNYAGILFQNGLTLALSSTKDTLTITTSDAGYFQAHYNLRNRGRG